MLSKPSLIKGSSVLNRYLLVTKNTFPIISSNKGTLYSFLHIYGIAAAFEVGMVVRTTLRKAIVEFEEKLSVRW